MLTFPSTDEAKQYAQHFGKYQYQHVKIANNNTILCGTDMAYEQTLYGDAQDIVENFINKFATPTLLQNATLSKDQITTAITTAVRDLVIEQFEEHFQTEFIDVYDEY